MISPTIGRVVWYRPAANEERLRRLSEQPMTAHVVHVHNDRMVNLIVFDHLGKGRARQGVMLMQDGDDRPVDENAAYCEWMPYQKGQAAKHDQASAATAQA